MDNKCKFSISVTKALKLIFKHKIFGTNTISKFSKLILSNAALIRLLTRFLTTAFLLILFFVTTIKHLGTEYIFLNAEYNIKLDEKVFAFFLVSLISL